MSTARKAAHAVVPIQKQRPLHAFRVPSVPAAPPACSENIFSSAPRSHPSCCHRGAELDVVAQLKERAQLWGERGRRGAWPSAIAGPARYCTRPSKLSCHGMHGRQRSLRHVLATVIRGSDRNFSLRSSRIRAQKIGCPSRSRCAAPLPSAPGRGHDPQCGSCPRPGPKANGQGVGEWQG